MLSSPCTAVVIKSVLSTALHLKDGRYFIWDTDWWLQLSSFLRDKLEADACTLRTIGMPEEDIITVILP